MNANQIEYLHAEIESQIADINESAAKIKAEIRESAEQSANVNREALDSAKDESNLTSRIDLHNHAERRLSDLRAAIQRMNTGTYGICLECDDSIGLSRLMARPGAKFCISCQRQTEWGLKMDLGFASEKLKLPETLISRAA